MTEIKDIVTKALETAKKLGAQNAAASMAHAQDIDVSWRKEKIETLASAGRSSLSIDLYVDGRYGSYSTSDLRPDSIDEFIKNNIAITRLLEEEPARGLADPERYKNRADVDLQFFDDNIAALTPTQLVERCRKFEQAVLEHKEIPISDVSIGSSCSIYESMMATSNGFMGSKKGTMIGEYCKVVSNDGDKKPSDYGDSQARHIADLRSHAVLAKEAVDFTSMLLGQKKIKSGKRTIILDRRAAASFIQQRYLSPIKGSSLIRKQSYFENKIGQKLASDLFDLHDDPLIVRGVGSRLYDGEGMSCQPAAIFDHGVLKQYFLSNYPARKLGLTATTGTWSNLVLTPGKRSLQDMIKDVKDGIYITGFLGGNMDELRGDFSFGIRGVAIENGELTVHVSEMNVDGNFTDIMNRLAEVGCDPRFDTSNRIPSLRFDDVSCSGS